MKLKMKWALNDEGKKAFIGYELVAESESEEKAMATIRNWIFWGNENEQPKYDGMTSTLDGRRVAALMWKMPANVERLKSGELHDAFEEIR